MVKKLLKNDLRKMSKVLIYIYIIAIVLSGITRLINIGKNIQFISIIGYVFSGLTYSALCSILVNTFVQILLTFWHDFYKDESYLTHTLPVKKSHLFLSKYLSSLIMILFSVIVCFVSLFIMLFTPTFANNIIQYLTLVVSNFSMPVWLFVTLFVLLIFAQICFMISIAFTAIVKANTYNTKRIIKGFLWFAIFYFGSTILTLLLFVVGFAISGNLSNLFATQLSQGVFLTIIIIGLILYVIYSVLYYFICYRLFKKGVNVD